MARAALAWSTKDLAREAEIAANTVVRFENGRHEANASTVAVIQRAFERGGVRFQDDGGVVPPKVQAEQVDAPGAPSD